MSNGSRALVRLALGISEGDARFEPRRQRLLELYAEILGQHARLYPGLASLLEVLCERGIAWGIATNKPRAYTVPLLEHLGLAPPPGAVVCPDDVAQPKPHPESLERICDALHCAPAEAIYVGDHARDVEAGQRAGMHTIAAAYGYIEEGDDPQRWGADQLVSASEDLAPALLAHATRAAS